jgi:hypothetical protein
MSQIEIERIFRVHINQNQVRIRHRKLAKPQLCSVIGHVVAGAVGLFRSPQVRTISPSHFRQEKPIPGAKQRKSEEGTRARTTKEKMRVFFPQQGVQLQEGQERERKLRKRRLAR